MRLRRVFDRYRPRYHFEFESVKMQELLRVIFLSFFEKAGPMRNVHNEKVSKKKKVHKNATHWSSGVFQGPAAVRVCKLCFLISMDVSPPPFLLCFAKGKKKLCSHIPVEGEGTHTYTLADVISRPLIKEKKEDSILTNRKTVRLQSHLDGLGSNSLRRRSCLRCFLSPSIR